MLLIGGFFQSFQFTATQAIVYADIEHQRMSTASSIASMAQQLSRGFGIAFAAGLLNLSLAWRGAGDLTRFDLQVAFVGATTFALLSILFCLPLARDAAAEVSGHRSKD